MTERNIPVRDLPPPPTITIASRLSVGSAVGKTGSTTPASGANPFNANDLLAFPFTVGAPLYVNKVFWVNGSSAGGNMSVGIYDADFRLLAQTASTGGTGNSVPQVVTMATKLSVGLYYCGLAFDGTTTNRFFRWTVATTGAGFWKMMGCWRQASVTLGALPNPATPAAYTAISFPVFGVITRTTFDV